MRIKRVGVMLVCGCVVVVCVGVVCMGAVCEGVVGMDVVYRCLGGWVCEWCADRVCEMDVVVASV